MDLGTSSGLTTVTAGKKLVRDLYEEVWNQRKVERCGEFMAEGLVLHGNPGITGRAAYQQFTERYLAAVPDYRIEIHEIVEEGNLVAFRWTCKGTHGGPLFGVPATGRSFTLTGMTLYRIAGGKVVEGWAERDTQGLLKQLGAA